jgi:hypothetical protein
VSCPICGKRPPKRFCPAKMEKICAVCCGRGREVTIDCPLDCSYLLASHRYEAEHRPPPTADEYPYKGVEFSTDFVYQHWPIVSGIGAAILNCYFTHKELNDRDVYIAIERLTESYQTLTTGIVYERAPEAPLPLALYHDISRFLREFRDAAAAQTGSSSVKDSDVFQLLVFMLRMNRAETSERPRSREFIGFLRARFPVGSGATAGAVATVAEAPRIIIP